MSITHSLANAYSGLSAANRTTEIISNNVANAMTEGYARQTLSLAQQTVGGRGAGVRVAGMDRVVDPALTAARQRAEASEAWGATISSGVSRLADAWGEPGRPGALATRAAAFATALNRLADTPESPSLQTAAARAAADYATKINAISTETDRVRMDADAAIGRQVETVNGALHAVERLNREIQIRTVSSRDTAALEQERETLVREINRIVPIRSMTRENGQIALYAEGGGALVDGRAFELRFTATGTITPDMTLASGALSGLELDGVRIDMSTGGLLSGGMLAATFALRDELAPEASAAADALARDLIERFQDPALDATRAPGDPGLFTDAGAAFADPLDEPGLAGRLALNAAVDPLAGGEARRLRDGLGSATPGPAGEDTLLRAMLEAFEDARAPSAGAGTPGAHAAEELAGRLSALRLDDAARAATDAGVRAATFESAAAAEASARGVDTDQEIARLMLAEQAYAANARVIEVVDSLLRRLMEI